jgi:F-type H+-transporting ATPase subunit b
VELNWTTFILEAVNFLVLVWILKRFLYKPVLAAIAQRKAAIDKTLSDAQARQADAQTLEKQFQNRLAEWEHEKEGLRTAFLEEVSQQRAQTMAALENSLAKERERARVLEERRLRELQDKAEIEGMATGLKFTARLLTRLASPGLESRLVDLALEDLALQPREQLEAIRTACEKADCRAKVITCFPLPEPGREVIAEKLMEMTKTRLSVEFAEDRLLLAGLRIGIGPWVLRANLQDELGSFADMVPHGT